MNGGGGGIVHNGGGGGGGNFTAGGNGYYGYTGAGYCSSSTNAGGQGGLAISSSPSRVFLGGGGGGGQENDNLGTAGGDGGGIILIKCDTIVLSGACGSESIRADGETANDSGNDGAGGGGAGGTIVLDIQGIRARSGCPLTISADGGDGGDVGNGASHGAGGGGGQGAIYIKASGPFANTTISTSNGIGGDANDGGGSPNAGSGGGTSGTGISTGSFTSPLPVELMFFRGEALSNRKVKLSWKTASEKNNRRFEVMHLENGGEWTIIGTLPGMGTKVSFTDYGFEHADPVDGMNYYKLRQVDDEGSSSYSDIVYVMIDVLGLQVNIFPNPSGGEVFIESSENLLGEDLYLISSTGSQVKLNPSLVKPGLFRLDLSDQPRGIYLLHSTRFSGRITLQ